MRKSKILSGLLLAVLAGVLLWQAYIGFHPSRDKLYDDFGDWLDQRVLTNRELDARRLAVQRFIHEALDLEAAYVANQLTLEEVVGKILAASTDHFPEHLEWIARAEQGDTHQERIARNIARHIEEDEDLNRNEALLQRLRGELAELLRKYQKPGPMMGSLAA